MDSTLTAFLKKEETKDVLLFLVNLVVIWFSWKLVFYIIGEEKIPINERLFPALSAVWEDGNDVVRWVVLRGAELLLKISGYQVINDGYRINIEGKRGLGLGNYCLGFQLFYYFSMLVMVSGLSRLKKLAAIVSAMPVIILINIPRMALLCIIVANRTSLLPLFHDYIFNAVVMGTLLLYYLLLLRSERR